MKLQHENIPDSVTDSKNVCSCINRHDDSPRYKNANG